MITNNANIYNQETIIGEESIQHNIKSLQMIQHDSKGFY